MMEQTNKEVIEIEYTKAKISKRLIAFIIDICLVIFGTILVTTFSNFLITRTDSYQTILANQQKVENDSGLFVDGVDIVDYVNENEEFSSIQEKNQYLSYSIHHFYRDISFFTIEDSDKVMNEYNQRKLDSEVDGTHLFKNDNGSIVENTVNPQYIYNFYVDEIDSYAKAYLTNSEVYLTTSQQLFGISLMEICVGIFVNCAVFYLILPLTVFKRGRQTLGMKIYKISLINYHAANISTGKYILRWFVSLIVFVPLNFVSFLIPTFLNVSMIFFSKTNSGLINYVFNDYMVDTSKDMIYLSEFERIEKNNKLQEISIENKELELTNKK